MTHTLIALAWIVICILAYFRAREVTTVPNVTILAVCIYEAFQMSCYALVA